MKATKIVLLVGILTLVLAAPGFTAAPNLLANPSFEQDGLVGNFTDVLTAPTGWTSSPVQKNNDGTLKGDWNWQGIYGSAWYNHNCNYPTWPDPVHSAVDGNYYLGKWIAPIFGCETHKGQGGEEGYIYQTLNGLAEGTYYFSVWVATHHPHFSGLARIVALPQTFNGTTYDPALNPTYPIHTPFVGTTPPAYASTKRVAAPTETGDTEVWPFYEANWAASDAAWKKITCVVTIPAGKNACTLFLSERTTSNDLAEPQYIQMDAARFAATQTLEIRNVEITNTTPSSATVEWDVYDGEYLVKGATTNIEYGTGTSYGATKPGIELDPNYCNSGTAGRPGHYTATLTGLSLGTQYHYRITVNEGTYTCVPGSWNCAAKDPEVTLRPYEAAQTGDFFPLTALPAITIGNITVPAATLTKDSAVITWTTKAGTNNVLATSQVNYGKWTALDQVKSDSTPVSTHSMTLTGLANNTSYSYTITASAEGYSTTTTTVKKFNTLPGPNIVNGDFEEDSHNGQKARAWTDAGMYGGPVIRLNNEFSIPSHSGNWHCGTITNGGTPPVDGAGIYQQIATNPGDIISVYAWSWANGQGIKLDKYDWPQGVPHRFGEINNQIGIDPTGAKMTALDTWLPTIVWGGQLSSLDWHTFAPNPIARTGGYRKIGVCTIAQSNLATIYLRTRSWFGNAWLFNTFDDVTLEPPTPIHSVSELKALPMQTNVNLTQGDYVVTYVERYGVTDENNGQPYFYIQDRKTGGAGIKVTLGPDCTWDDTINKGQKLNIIGTLDWGIFTNLRFGNHEQQTRLDKPAGEPVLRAVKIEKIGTPVSLPEPVAVTNFSLGGGSSADPYFTNAGVAGGAGANNVGMRVRTWGKIVEIGTKDNYIYMVVDDGSRLPLPPAPGFAVENVQVAIQQPGEKDPTPSLRTGTMIQTTKIADYQHEPGLFVQTWLTDWPTNTDGSQVAVGDYVILTGISGVRLDLDPDDHQCVVGGSDPEHPQLIPEAEKNMRFIKLDEVDGAKFFNLP